MCRRMVGGGLAGVSDTAKELQDHATDLEMNFNKIALVGKEGTAKELQDHAADTQDTLVDAVGSEIEMRFEAGLPAKASPGESY